MTDPRPSAGPIHSEFASDADMRELIQMFVDELPQRLAELEEAWHEADAAHLGRIAHQLKGAGAGYGFQVLTDAARELEQAVRSSEADLNRVRAEFDALVDVCSRAAV